MIGCNFDSNELVFSRLPDSLRDITIKICYMKVVFEQPLPALLKTFSLDMEDALANINAGVLPAVLHALELGGSQHQQLDYLPPDLRVLKLRDHEHPLPQLPGTLETLVLNQCTHHVAHIPDSLRSLSVYWCHPGPPPPPPACWPPQLEHLIYWILVDSDDPDVPQGLPHILLGSLPPTVRQLELNGCAIDADLPQALQELRLGHEFEQILTLKNFRGSVTINGDNSEQIEFGW
eukprot:TRINITY_DN3419_c0_g1_i3.p1 TRINITY_DN3419_c0_g1~~TRINITY_DN3419_c0_g1_i3.p1  ORF type:complete len:234 (-),score=24.22 TRINITY_DN3419_c0_g1_i3:47-748(-)